MVQILLIGQDHPLYEQELELRNRVLLNPIGISVDWLEQRWPGCEAGADHFVAVIEHPKGSRVVGCVLLLPHQPDENTGKLMQMAVDPQRRHEGIGRRLTAELERRAFGELGLTSLFCHAREGADDFYRRLGWLNEGDRFEEAGIGHFKMVFRPTNVEFGATQR